MVAEQHQDGWALNGVMSSVGSGQSPGSLAMIPAMLFVLTTAVWNG